MGLFPESTICRTSASSSSVIIISTGLPYFFFRISLHIPVKNPRLAFSGTVIFRGSRTYTTRCPLGGAFASVIGLVVMIPHGSRVVVSTNVTCHPFPTTIRKRPSTNVSSPSGEVRPKAAMIRSAMRDTAFPR